MCTTSVVDLALWRSWGNRRCVVFFYMESNVSNEVSEGNFPLAQLCPDWHCAVVKRTLRHMSTYRIIIQYYGKIHMLCVLNIPWFTPTKRRQSKVFCCYSVTDVNLFNFNFISMTNQIYVEIDILTPLRYITVL